MGSFTKILTNSQNSQNFHPDFGCHARAVDEDNPLPPVQKPRGYGGTAIFYNKQLKATHLKDGNHRITCIEVSTRNTRPIIFISVYMPAKGAAARDLEYAETLDSLEEIVLRYQNTHHVAIGGDFNASMFADHPDSRDKVFRAFISKDYVKLAEDHPTSPTYTKPDGTECSSLDYILTDQHTSSSSSKITMYSHDTSDHYPVHTKIHADPDIAQKAMESLRNPRSTKSWAKVDLTRYKEILDEQLSISNLPEDISSQYDACTTLDKVSKLMVQTKNQLAPRKKSSRPGKSSLQPKWTPAMAAAAELKKKAFHTWKMAGRPNDLNDPALKEHKKYKKKFRKVQRKQVAANYKEDLEDIAQAKFIDTKTFHKLVKLRSGTKVAPAVNELIVDGIKYEGDQVIHGWVKHFSKLARPSSHCDDYAMDTESHINHLTHICRAQNKKIPPISPGQLKKAISKLNTGKATDLNGLAMEHLKYSPDSVITATTKAINFFTQNAAFPDKHKSGALFPAHKKLEIYNPYNHRGITVVDLFCKLYEITLKLESDPILLPTQSVLQRGFTEDTPALLAGLMIQEQIYEARRTKKPLYITLLDVKTAFDVVWHQSLLKKLHRDGVQGDLWLAIKDLYTNAMSRVSWKGEVSEPFPILQGVRQGAVLSSDLYKRFNNPLLESLKNSGWGGHIGTTSLPAPTCADDVALCSNDPLEMQALIDIVHRYSQKERYEIQARKSAVLVINDPNPAYPTTFYMGDKPIPNVCSGTHIGVVRDRKGGPEAQVDHNVTTARKAAYHLMGAGLHGKNGLPHSTCLHLYQIYVLPILTYGLSIFSIEERHIKPLERFQKSMLKQLLTLADNTADPALYILSGVAPIELEVHRQALSIFGSIARHPKSAEWELANRQLIMQDYDAEEWFAYIRRLCSKYNLPSPASLLENPPSKPKWKSMYDRQLKQYWTSHVISHAAFLQKARYLNPQVYNIGNPHPAIRFAPCHVKDIQKCTIKLQLITGSYILQAQRARFNQFDVKPECLLCGREPETRTHFLITCQSLQQHRTPHLTQIEGILKEKCDNPQTVHELCNDPLKCTALLLDCTAVTITSHIILTKDAIAEIEKISQRLIFSLHQARMNMLAILAPGLRRKRGKTNVKPMTNTISLQRVSSTNTTHLQIEPCSSASPVGGTSC